jgi:hypothetical protein
LNQKHLGRPSIYDIKAAELAKFKANFKFEEFNAEIMAGAPNA